MHFLIATFAGFVIIIFYIALIVILFLLKYAYSFKKHCVSDSMVVLLTGRVESINWCRSHLLPICETPCVKMVFSVMDGPLFCHDKLHNILPPAWSIMLFGRLLSRFIWLFITCIKVKPDVIVGYSFFPSAVSALLFSKITGKKAIYQMAGGPFEIQNGGIVWENSFLSPTFTSLLTILSKYLVRNFDAIVVRGENAKRYLSTEVGYNNVCIIAGSVSYTPQSKPFADRTNDIVFLGRFSPFKQPLLIVQIVRLVSSKIPWFRAVMAGDGPLLDECKRESEHLGVADRITFTGKLINPEKVLAKSRVFVLTSKSEGLSIALAEAMTLGTVPVVFDVGDLAELVKNGQTGFLVPAGDISLFSDRLISLLTDQSQWSLMSSNSVNTAYNNNSIHVIILKWTSCFKSLYK